MRTDIILKKPIVPVAILACLGLLLTLNLTAIHGAGVSTDAVNYLAAADHLAAGEGFINFEGEPYVLWPPLYPALLAAPSALFGLDPIPFATGLNAIAFSAIIFVAGILASRVLDSHWSLSTLAAAACLLSVGTFAVSVNIGSDPLFIVLLLSWLLLFEKYGRAYNRSSFAGMIALCGLACLQRYIGATLIVTGAAGILYVRRSELRRGLAEASTFAGLSALPLILWILRNYGVSGTFLGLRDPSTWRPDQNLQDIAFKASRWFVPYQVSSKPFFWLALVAAIALLIIYLRRRGTPLKSGPLRPITLVLIVFSVIYLLAVVVLTKSVDHMNIPYDDRLYLPAFFTLLLLGLLFVRQVLLPLFKGKAAPIWRSALIGVSFLWLVFPANGTYKFWLRSLDTGGIAYYNIYNTPAYRDSAITKHLAPWATDPATPVFSNYPAAVYLTTRRIVRSLPSRTDFYGASIPLDAFVGVWPGTPSSVLVWYEPNTKRDLYSLTALAELAFLRPEFVSDDGAIYQIQTR
jgi:hypothetical protein